MILLNRASERSESSLSELQKEVEKTESDTDLFAIDCDLSSFASVREAAQKVNERTAELGGIDVLINNAGIEGKCWVTEDNFLTTAQINHLSHFLLTSLLLERLEQAAEDKGEARIVNHSSGYRQLYSFNKEHYKVTDKTKAKLFKRTNLYACTKIANVLFSLELNKRLKDSKVIAVTAEPGISTTSLLLRSLKSKMSRMLSPTQSAADGSMSLITAAFGKDTKANDFFCPGGFLNLRGKPIKALKEGKPQWLLYNESNVRNEKDSKTLWELSVKATGEEFLLTKE